MTCHQILIVDDEADSRETLKELLELSGFQAVTAANGKEALRLLDEMGRFCLVVLDLTMPVMSGWDLLETLDSERRPLLTTMPVTVLSGSPDAAGAQRRFGCRVMQKPPDIALLLSVAGQYCCAAG